MTTIRRTISISPELDMAIAKLVTSSGSNYSKFVSEYLLTNDKIRDTFLRLGKLPTMPSISTEDIMSITASKTKKPLTVQS